MAAQTPTLWNPKVLISFWTFQTVSALVIIGLLAWAAVVLSQQDPSDVSVGLGPIDIYTIFISSLSIILMIAEAVMYKKKQLRPASYLTTNVVKTTFWTVLLILEIIVTAFASFNFIALVIIIVTFLSHLGALIYGSVIYHRWRVGRLDEFRHPEVDAKSLP